MQKRESERERSAAGARLFSIKLHAFKTFSAAIIAMPTERDRERERAGLLCYSSSAGSCECERGRRRREEGNTKVLKW